MPPTPQLLRIASWNIEFGLRVVEAIDTIEAHEQLAEADVLMLQEMDEDGVGRIADSLGAQYSYSAASIHRKTGREFGNAVISRHPLVSEPPLPLPHKPRFRGEWRIAVSADVDIGGTGVRVVSSHTEIPTLRMKFRSQQFAAVATAAAQADVAVVGGDFNTVTRRGVHTLRSVMNDHGMATVELPEPTTLTWPQGARRSVGLTLDHLFVRGMTVTSSGVVRTASGSDHWPIWMTATAAAHPPDRRQQTDA